MKKMNFILKLFVLAVIVTFSACSKDEKATPVTSGTNQKLSTDNTATVQGLVYATLNDTLDTKITQYAPVNTPLLFTYTLNQFHPYLTATTDQTVECPPVLVAADGSYSITVPAVASGIKIVLQSNQFVYMQKGRSQYTGNDTTFRKVYTLASQTISGLVPGELKIIDLTYSDAK
jgi:hypothetical protein